MKVDISQIPDEGLTLCEDFDPAGMNLQIEELRFSAPVKVTVLFQKERDTIVVQVEAIGETNMVCGRCLGVYHEYYDRRFHLGYSVKGMVSLDVTDDIRQEILLSYPAQFVCREECLGLCPRCGKNLNLGPCGCGPAS